MSEATSKPLTVSSIVFAILVGNLLTGAVSAALYFAAKWLLWQ